MAAASNPSPGAPAPGLFASISATFSSWLDYLKARLQLFGLESKEALLQYLKIIALLAAAAVLVLFAYILLLIGIIFLLAALLKIWWVWVALVVCAAHLGGAFACLMSARTLVARPVFGTTISEFKRDQEWLTNRPASVS